MWRGHGQVMSVPGFASYGGPDGPHLIFLLQG